MASSAGSHGAARDLFPIDLAAKARRRGVSRKGASRIRPDAEALIAGFPAGTVSGAPKVGAMQIIDELEPERHNFYAGAVGYFGGDGSMDTCIALRTALVKDGKM